MSAAPLEFWFEFASTYSYPAAMRVEAAARAAGVPLAWRPFLLGPIFRAQGWNDSPFNIYPAKGRYMWRDLERICAQLGLPLRRPSVFPRNGLLAARVACRFADEAWCADFVRAVYSGNFAEDREIADADVVASCLERAGQPARERIEAALAPESKERLRAQSERAVALGIIGAPTFTVGAELFWGNDRLETALAWWQRERDDLARAAAP
jgi:2-hydroxychromene-2-carboxylate isomerase